MEYYLRSKVFVHDTTGQEDNLEHEDSSECFSGSPEKINAAIDSLNLLLQKEISLITIDGREYIFKAKAALQDSENKLPPLECRFDRSTTDPEDTLHETCDLFKKELFLLLPLAFTPDSILVLPEKELTTSE